MGKGDESDYISFDDAGAKGGAARGSSLPQRAAQFNPFRMGGKGDDEISESPSAPSYFEAVHASESVMAASKEIRMGFLRKVYGTLTIQLAVTAALCAFAIKATNPMPVGGEWYTLSLGSFLAGNQMFYLFTFIISIVILCFLFCARHQYPANVFLLGCWTFAMAFSIATACVMAVCDPLVVGAGAPKATPLSKSTAAGTLSLAGGVLQCAVGTPYAEHGGNSVLLAAGLTAGLFVALSVFTVQSKIDFSFLGAGLFASVWILLIWGIAMSFMGGGAVAQYWYALIGSIIFSLYIVFDTWLIANKMGPDEYIAATINLYLDIVNLFLMLLQLLRRD